MLSQIQANLAQMQGGATNAAIVNTNGSDGTGPSFTAYMGTLIRSVDEQGQQAEQMVKAVELGTSDDLVGAMLQSQQASLSFQMMMQVRNKVVSAVDELIKLQL